MKTKKTYYLFIMLAVLIAHTVVLSTWLKENKSGQKHANYSFDNTSAKSADVSLIKVKYLNNKDSVYVLPAVLKGLGTKFK